MADELTTILTEIDRLEADVRALRASGRRRRHARIALRLSLVALLSSAASWALAQAIDFRSDDNGTERVRFAIEPNAAPVGTDASAYFSRVNLGIGTSAPAAVVDVVGTDAVGIRYLKSGSKDARIWVGDATQTWGLSSGWATAGDFSLIEELVSGNRIYVQQGTGKVGIGTSSPAEPLYVEGNIYVNGGQLRVPNYAAAPAGLGTGSLYYDTTAAAFYLYKGAAWEPLATGTGSGAPTGAIGMWSPTQGAVPSGWAVCDGTGGTPDLRDRFLVGAGTGGTYAPGDSGGSSSHSHSVDMPSTASASGGAHTHWTDIGAFGATSGGESANHTHWVNPPGGSNGNNHDHGGGSLAFKRKINPVDGDCGGGCFTVFGTLLGPANPSNQFWRPSWTNSTTNDDWHGHGFGGNWMPNGISAGHTHGYTVDLPGDTSTSVGGHTHSTNPAAVASASVSAEPPYYSLIYIVKQ